MRILFVGDVVGRSGRTVVAERLPGLIRDWKLDCVVINGENAAGGFGITETIYSELIEAGADAVTLGNHAWDQKEALVFIERAPRLIRPINYPAGTPGRGAALIEGKNGGARAGRQCHGPHLHGSARRSVRRRRPRARAPARCARAPTRSSSTCTRETTSEKQAMGYFCDGRASLVVGTHTHAPTADLRILPGGTAFMSDVGMTGDYDSVIGMTKEEPMQRFLRRDPSSRFEPATGPATLVRRSRSRPIRRPGLRRASARCGSAAAWSRRCPHSGAGYGPCLHFLRCGTSIGASLRAQRRNPVPIETDAIASSRCSSQ